MDSGLHTLRRVHHGAGLNGIPGAARCRRTVDMPARRVSGGWDFATERETARLAQALRHSERQLRLLAEDVSDIMW